MNFQAPRIHSFHAIEWNANHFIAIIIRLIVYNAQHIFHFG